MNQERLFRRIANKYGARYIKDYKTGNYTIDCSNLSHKSMAKCIDEISTIGKMIRRLEFLERL